MKKSIFIFFAIILVSCSSSNNKYHFIQQVREIQRHRELLNDSKFEVEKHSYLKKQYEDLLISTRELNTFKDYPLSDTIKIILLEGISQDINDLESIKKIDWSDELVSGIAENVIKLNYFNNVEKLTHILKIESSLLLKDEVKNQKYDLK
ncbi:MAG TPA: hypothetical protein PLG90_04660 [Ignavibacteria bacterium]|nr:hypothetical protein [Ignavibacteria bacterium]